MTKANLTIIILAKNEEKNLRELLPTLDFASEIIVIDDDSVDQTETVSKKFGAKYFKRSLQGDFANQRNFGLSKAKNDWVLFIDPDERLSGKLKEEIVSAVELNDDCGYQIKREDIFYQKRLCHGELKDIWLTRLGKRTGGEWFGKVHEVWRFDLLKKLNGVMDHYSHTLIRQLFSSVDSYAKIRAEELFDKQTEWSLWEQLMYPIGKLFVNMFAKLGILDGWQGFMMAIAMSYHSFRVRQYLWKLQGQSLNLQLKITRILWLWVWLLLPLGQLGRWQITNQVAINGFEVLMMWIVGLNLPRLFHMKWPKWLKLTWGFLGILLVSLIASIIFGGGLVASLYWLRLCSYVLFLSVSYGLIADRKINISIVEILKFEAVSITVGGWLQYLLLPDMRFGYWLGWDDHYYRMVGTLLDPNFLGLMLVLSLLTIWNNVQGRGKYVLTAVSVFGILATFSRTAYVLMILVAVVTIIKRINKKLIIGGAIAIVTVLGAWMVLPKPGGEGVNIWRKYSITSRIETWNEGYKQFLTAPLIGIGYNQYPTKVSRTSRFGLPYHATGPDSSWIHILACSGIVGLLAMIVMVVGWWRYLSTQWQQLSLGVIILHAAVNNSLFYPWVILWIWLLLLAQTRTTRIESN